jgi:hypothetical protein
VKFSILENLYVDERSDPQNLHISEVSCGALILLDVRAEASYSKGGDGQPSQVALLESARAQTAPAARTAASAARAAHTAAAVPSTVIHTATDSTIAVCTRRCTCMYPTSCVGGADRAGVDGVGCAPSAVLAGVVLLLSVGSAHAARPWSVQFGGCVFSGVYDGAPLVRSGSCPTQGGELYLGGRGITSVKSDSFADMGACQ